MLRSLVCFVVLLNAAAFAQTMPGTFKSATGQGARPVWNATVLAPPVATLSNGLSPAVIANQNTVVYQVANPMAPIIPSSAEEAESSVPNDYLVSSTDSVYTASASDDSRTLGEAASSFRGTKQQRRVYTNDDIQKLPTKFGPSSNPAPQPPANPQ